MCVVLLALGLCACVQSSPVSSVPQSKGFKEKVVQKIWHNECAGTVKGLVSWNVGEEFPSLGIAHFIWMPTGYRSQFGESFPEFIAFCEKHNVKVPGYFKGGAPWKNRAAFLRADVPGGLPDKMRAWLSQPGIIRAQGDFVLQRSYASLDKIKRVSSRPQEIVNKYRAVASTPNGTYALIDYVNFKGEGLAHPKQYNGQGWGLRHVLEEMRPVRHGQAAAVEFAEAAKRVLRRRVRNSNPARGESRWLAGWMNRCESYKQTI